MPKNSAPIRGDYAYAAPNDQAQQLSRLDQSAFKLLVHQYHHATMKPLTQLYVSALGSANKPDLPTTVTISALRRKKPLRDFLTLVIRCKNDHQEAELLDAVTSVMNQLNHPDYILYPYPDYQASTRNFQWVVPTSRYLNRAQATVVTNYLASLLQLSFSISKTKNNGFKPFPLPIYSDPTLAQKVQLEDHDQPLPIDEGYLEAQGVGDDDDADKDDKTQATITYSQTQIDQSTQTLIADPQTKTLLADDAKRQQLILSLAGAVFQTAFTYDQVNAIATKLAMGQAPLVAQYQGELKAAYQELKQHPDKRLQAAPISEYLRLYQSSSNSQNIGQQLLAHLDDDFMPDADLKLADAANMIAMVYPPAIIDQAGSDRDNVVIFNPLTGVWTHDEDLFYSLLTAVKPYSTVYQLDTLMRTFAANARNMNRYIRPYSGSQYLLFLNGVLDITDLSFHSLTEPFVEKAHFIDRSQLNLDFVPNPPLPVIPHARQVDGGDWNPRDFIRAYGNNDDTRIQYLLFGLSLGLFGGHNFGVHFDIQGESRWGKTTLSEIYNYLYNNRTVIVSWPSLNGRFPFTSYPLNTSVIWVKEANIGTAPLDDEHGTIIYDGLADNQVRFEVKGSSDIVLVNPPQVYIDGTQLIQASEINTGPAGRTLAYKLPLMTQTLRAQAYANNIVERLHSPDVVMWLVWQMILAYRATIPANRLADLKLNLSLQTDLNLLPPMARSWRLEFAAETSDLVGWFTERIEPFLSDDPMNPTMMHDQVLYDLYDAYYIQLHPYDKYRNRIKSFETFQRQIKQVFSQHGWNTVPVGNLYGKRKAPAKKVSTLDALNFDWVDYDLSYKRPKDLIRSNNLPSPFGSVVSGWYQLTKALDD